MDFLKLKLNSFWLIIIILVQIIMIEAVLTAVIIRKNDTSQSPAVHISNNIHNNVKPISTKSLPAGNNNKFRMIRENFPFFRDIFREFYLNAGQISDFRLPEESIFDGDFIITAYDLSYESCGKYPSDPAYGITFSGKKAVRGETVAVDPDIIPLGCNVYIELKGEYGYLSGWYIAEDTGKKVRGNIIDIFFGKSAFRQMEKFGSRKAKVKIIGSSNPVP